MFSRTEVSGHLSYIEDNSYSFRRAFFDGVELENAGRFVVITTSYIGVNRSITEAPVVEEFGDEVDYIEAVNEWEAKVPHVSTIEEMDAHYPEGRMIHTVVSFNTREDFENELSEGRIPGIHTDYPLVEQPQLDTTLSTENIYVSRPSNSLDSSSNAYFYEIFVM